MSTARRLLRAAGAAASAEARATDLDGTNDYLSRASDFTGNADGKTFTWSGWVYRSTDLTSVCYSSGSSPFAAGFTVATLGNTFRIYGFDSGGTQRLNFNLPSGLAAFDTWVHLLVSVDMANGLASAYVNDLPYSGATTADFAINFTNSNHYSGRNITHSSFLTGRLADVFLDYTYRDLSIEANRRLFTTIDPALGLVPVAPSALGAMSPIMTAFTNPDDLTENLGTGGAWTQNGVMARSNRGPNQYNAVASEFDGTADRLSKAAKPTGVIDSKLLTISFNFDKVDDTVSSQILWIANDANTNAKMSINIANGDMSFTAFTVGADGPTGSSVSFSAPYTAGGVAVDSIHRSVQISFDTSNISNRYVFVNGAEVTGTWTAYVIDDLIALTETIAWGVGARTTANVYHEGSLGEFYLGQEYIDLSVNNPFWDAETNKPKYLGELGELPTGSQPLIYLPIRAGTEGSNLGSGGNFTVNSGPFIGARGASEYWARSAKFDGSTGYMSRTSLTGLADSKTLSMVISIAVSTTSQATSNYLFTFGDGTADNQIYCYISGVERFDFNIFRNAGFTTNPPAALGNDGLDMDVIGEWNTFFITMDAANGISKVVSGGVESTGTIVDENIILAAYTEFLINRSTGGTVGFAGSQSSIYMTTDYIDFTDEANRLLFVDALGYPVPLQQSIDDGLIPEGLIRMGFEDSGDLGLNSGTGGDFTINGTITSGSDVNSS